MNPCDTRSSPIVAVTNAGLCSSGKTSAELDSTGPDSLSESAKFVRPSPNSAATSGRTVAIVALAAATAPPTGASTSTGAAGVGSTGAFPSGAGAGSGSRDSTPKAATASGVNDGTNTGVAVRGVAIRATSSDVSGQSGAMSPSSSRSSNGTSAVAVSLNPNGSSADSSTTVPPTAVSTGDATRSVGVGSGTHRRALNSSKSTARNAATGVGMGPRPIGAMENSGVGTGGIGDTDVGGAKNAAGAGTKRTGVVSVANWAAISSLRGSASRTRSYQRRAPAVSPSRLAMSPKWRRAFRFSGSRDSACSNTIRAPDRSPDSYRACPNTM